MDNGVLMFISAKAVSKVNTYSNLPRGTENLFILPNTFQSHSLYKN